MKEKCEKNIIVVGSTNMDMAICADRFPRPGETIIGHDFMSNFGGKGANQAVAAARLGGNISFIGKVGDDSFGLATIKHLQEEKIDISNLKKTPLASSGVALITTVTKGENTIIVNSGANSLLSPSDIEQASSLFEQAAIVLLQLETPVPTLVAAAEMAKRHGALVILNPAPAPQKKLPESLLKNTDILIPNETETCMISEVEVIDEKTAEKAISIIQSLGIKHVIITAGAKGVFTMIDGVTMNIPAYQVETVDTTAAGDTFCGALCVAILRGLSMTEAIRFANKASSISVTRKGAQLSMPYLSEIKL